MPILPNIYPPQCALTYLRLTRVSTQKSTVVVDPGVTKARGFLDPSKPHTYLKHDFILPTVEEAEEAKKGLKLKLKSHL